MLPLPRSPLTRRIVLAYTVNRLGTWFGYVALSIAVFDRTHSALAVAVLLLAGQLVPALLVPFVVARTETRRSRGGLSALYVIEALTSVALVAVIQLSYSLPGVLVLVAIDGTAALAASALLRTAASRSAREFALAAHGPAAQEAAVEEERVANAALNIGFAVTFTLGPALAGVVVPAFGVPTALLIDAASFLACAALLIDQTPSVQEGADASVMARIRAGRAHLGASPTLRALLGAQAVAMIFFTFGGPLEVAYAKASLHAGDSGYGLLVGAWGLGVALGSVVFARSTGRSLVLLLSASTLAVGAAYIGMAAAGSIALAGGVCLVGGVGNGVQWAALISSVQRLTPQSVLAQMMGAVEGLGAVAPALGYTLAGAIAALSSPREALLIGGLGASMSAAVFLRLQGGALDAGGAAQAPALSDAAS